MGLTRCCYKTGGFYICSFSTIFYAISISDTCLRSRKSISIPNFNNISQSTAKIWLLPDSKKGRHFEILLPVSILTMCTHRHVILHLPAKFCSNRTNSGGVMRSYGFFTMTTVESEIYFWVQVWWLHSFKEVKIYLHAKFRRNILVHGWDKSTSVLQKRTAAILKFYLLFQFSVTYG